MISPEALEALMGQSIDALSAILRDPAVPARERADIALRLLALGLGGGDVAAPADVLAVQFVTVPDFLPPELHADVVRTTLDNRQRFTQSTVTTNEAGYRESLVLHASEFPALYDVLRQEIMAALPAVLDGLDHSPFAVTQLEMQITGHADGNFFKAHSDASSPDIAARELTYVYYFQPGPLRGFGGGGLRIYETYLRPGGGHDPATFRDVEPTDNSIVFFDSRLIHEVLPVSVPSGAFEDWRFTVNGWLRR